MKKARKGLCLLLLVVFSITLLTTGCGTTSKTTETTPAATSAGQTTAAVETTPALKPYTITWYMRGKGPEKDEALVLAEANKFLTEKINATLKLVMFDRASYEQKITAIITSGEAFDICFTANWVNNYLQNATRGAFLPINDPANDILTKFAPKTKELLGPEFLGGSAIKGINYAIPINKERAAGRGFIYRKDIAEKYKLDVNSIKKFEDLEPLLKAVKESDPLMNYPLSAVNNEYPQMYVLGWQKPVDPLVPVVMYNEPGKIDTKVYFSLETPEEQAHYDTMRKFYNEGLIRKDAATLGDYTIDMTAGKIFARVGGLKPGVDAEMTNAYGVPYGAYSLVPYAVMATGDAMGAMQAISRTSKDPERAMMFLELINTDKYLNNLINFGIENKHYVKVSENVIDYMPDSDKGKNSGYNPQMQWGFANQFLNYLFPNEDPDKWKKYEEFNKTAIPSIDMGFVFDQSKVENEIAACKNVWGEYLPGLVTGSSDPKEVLPKAIDKFKEAGVQKIIDECQAQFDAWYATKKK